MKKLFIIVALFLLPVLTASGQALRGAEYFVDHDPGPGNANAISVMKNDSFAFTLNYNTDTLEPGLHFIYVRVMDSTGQWSLYWREEFIVDFENTAPLVAAEYFIDDDPGKGKGTSIPVTKGDSLDFSLNIPTGSLNPGQHYAYVRTKDSAGTWSLYMRQVFVVETQRDADLISGEYFIGPDPGVGNGNPISFAKGDSVDFNLNIDTDTMSIGEHTVQVRVVDEDGVWSLYLRDTLEVLDCNIAPGDADFSTSGFYCEGGTLTFAHNVTSPPTLTLQFDWDIDNDGTIDTSNIPKFDYVFPAAGQFDVTLFAREKAENLCYDKITKTISINPNYADTTTAAICAGDSLLFAGNYYSMAGTYYDSSTTALGCDSISVLELTLHLNPNIPVITRTGTDLTSSVANSYQWYFNGNPVMGATAQTFTPTENGKYSVEIIDTNGCSSISADYTVDFVGIIPFFEEHISIYPNPSRGSISIENPNRQPLEIYIYTSRGKLVHREALKEANRELPFVLTPGLYLIKVISEGKEVKGEKVVVR